MKAGKHAYGDKGFTLIEVLVSMLMLAIVVIPLLSYFVSAASYNARAKSKQTATVIAQSIMEKCKSQSIEDIAREIHCNPTDFLNQFRLVNPANIINPSDSLKPDLMVGEVYLDGSSVGVKGSSGSYVSGAFTTANSLDGFLYYKISNISNISDDGNRYDALISIDTNKDSGDIYHSINEDPFSQVETIQSPSDIVAAETTQIDKALYLMQSLNSNYCFDVNQLHIDDTGWHDLVPASEAEIRSKLVRAIYIDIDSISGNTDSVKVKVYYKYYCDISGCPSTLSNAIEVDLPLFSETVALADFKNIYLFFQKIDNTKNEPALVILDIDNTTLTNTSFDKFGLHLVEQAIDEDDITAPAYSINLIAINFCNYKIDQIYTNADSTTVNSTVVATLPYITQNAELRLMNITVDIYEAGHLLDDDFLLATLESTKEE